ncbi:hypothetical protein [Marinospirillum sp.]|uniref:hypothetical protein n=1 Tax=Marinospirillum sp. TaxID=2183934 RepID=UPI003851370F
MAFKRRSSFNPKRRMQAADEEVEFTFFAARYGGNPEHKRNPGDFNLTPPSNPRPHKSLCDDAEVFSRQQAENLLRSGIAKGCISNKSSASGWPQNVWAVTENGVPLEAQLENPQQGVYHGYPMPEQDPMASQILREWSQRNA